MAIELFRITEDNFVVAQAQAAHGGGAPYTQETVVVHDDDENRYVVGTRASEGGIELRRVVMVEEVFPYDPNLNYDEEGDENRDPDIVRAYAEALQALVKIASMN